MNKPSMALVNQILEKWRSYLPEYFLFFTCKLFNIFMQTSFTNIYTHLVQKRQEDPLQINALKLKEWLSIKMGGENGFLCLLSTIRRGRKSLWKKISNVTFFVQIKT